MDNRHPAAPPSSHGSGGYEKSDLSAKAIVIFGVALAGVLVLTLLVAAWMLGFFASWQAQRDAPPSPLATTRAGVPEPRLQVEPIKDLRSLRAAEDKILMSYGWVSRDAGIVRIPIERAMQLLVERGLPRPATSERVQAAQTRGGTQ